MTLFLVYSIRQFFFSFFFRFSIHSPVALLTLFPRPPPEIKYQVDAQAVRAKFDARFQYLIIAAAQYAAPALTVLLSLAVMVHLCGDVVGSGSGTAAAAGVGGVPPAAAAASGMAIAGDGLGGGEGGGTVTSALAVVGGGFRLGVCDAARRVAGLRDWDTAFEAAASASVAAADDVRLGLDEEGAAAAVDWSGGGRGSVGVLFSSIPEFPTAFWSGVGGFLAWWACLSWAVTYAIGVAFWRLCPEDVSSTERGRADTTTKGKREKGKGKAKAKGGGGKGSGGRG